MAGGTMARLWFDNKTTKNYRKILTYYFNNPHSLQNNTKRTKNHFDISLTIKQTGNLSIKRR